MKVRALALRRRHDALVAQIAVERAAIAQQGAALRPVARMMDRVNESIHYLQRHSVVLLLPIAVMVVWRPRRLVTFAVNGLRLWWLARGIARRD